MVSRKTLFVGLAAVGGVMVAGRRYQQDRTTPRVEYESVSHVDAVEIRRYPPTVLVETVALTENQAFRKLFRYLSGANRSGTEVSMTAPVESDPTNDGGDTVAMTAPVESASVSMTAPVESDRTGERVRMAFYLPKEYDYDSAPRPTDDSVHLVERPGRTLAALGFSWWATDSRVEAYTEILQSTLEGAEPPFEILGEPFLMRYEGPWVPPFLRTNEVAVEVRRTSST